MDREAVINIKPSIASQKNLRDYSRKVFGETFELWNAVSKPVPYHVTIAQTSQLTNKLKLACRSIPQKNDIDSHLRSYFQANREGVSTQLLNL